MKIGKPLAVSGAVIRLTVYRAAKHLDRGLARLTG